MSTPLLTAKYHLPPSASHSVVRLRLLNRLDEQLLPGIRLALVSSLAGSGKTTSVYAWVDRHTREGSGVNSSDMLPLQLRKPLVRSAWLSLEDEDNDPAIFKSFLVAAL